MKLFFFKYLKFFAYTIVMAVLAGACAGGWWLIVPAAVSVIVLAYVSQVVSPEHLHRADGATWKPLKTQVLALLPDYAQIMAMRECAKENYQPNRHDCDDYATAGIAVLHELLIHATAGDPAAAARGIPIYPFSFRRENGQRHRLFFVETEDAGRLFVENYPVFDKYHDEETGLIRFLTDGEKINGRVIS